MVNDVDMEEFISESEMRCQLIIPKPIERLSREWVNWAMWNRSRWDVDERLTVDALSKNLMI